MLNRVVSWLFLSFMALSSMILFIFAVLIWCATVMFDKRLAVLHLFTCFWASIYTWLMPPWPVTIKGRENIIKKTTYVIVSNHQSQLDILVAFRLFFHFKWVSKAEVFRLPFIGWNMVLNRYVKIRRGDKDSIMKLMQEAERNLANGSSLFFFPEGTRSSTGLLKTFKPGAFILAHKMKLPILPIAINGTRKALPKHSLNFHGRFPISIKILKEIPYQHFADLSIEETAEMVRQILAQNIEEHLSAQTA
jgi:1-acyl-sn-glycerol-3-phosphate acyltransferase